MRDGDGGASGGAKAGSQPVIPVGPGPSYPRVPRGITQPPEPFGPQSGLGIEPLSPLPESERPLSGSFGVARLGDLKGPPTGLTIDQVIDRVLRINLELRAQAMEISKARADVLTAGVAGEPLDLLGLFVGAVFDLRRHRGRPDAVRCQHHPSARPEP